MELVAACADHRGTPIFEILSQCSEQDLRPALLVFGENGCAAMVRAGGDERPRSP